MRFVNNNAASAYSSAGAKGNGTDAERFLEFWYANFLTSASRTVRQSAFEIVSGNFVGIHDSGGNVAANWAINGTVDPDDHEILILIKTWS